MDYSVALNTRLDFAFKYNFHRWLPQKQASLQAIYQVQYEYIEARNQQPNKINLDYSLLLKIEHALFNIRFERPPTKFAVILKFDTVFRHIVLTAASVRLTLSKT